MFLESPADTTSRYEEGDAELPLLNGHLAGLVLLIIICIACCYYYRKVKAAEECKYFT